MSMRRIERMVLTSLLLKKRTISACVLCVTALMLGLSVFALPAFSQERIVYTRPNGRVSVVVPAEACLRQLMRLTNTPRGPGECPALGVNRAGAVNWIRDKDVPPEGSNIRILDATALPPRSRTDATGNTQNVRDAWRQHPDGTVTIDETRVPRP